MLNRVALLLAAFVLAFSTPAAAWFPHGTSSGGGSSPVVTPGGTQPAYDAASSTSSNLLLTNVVVNNISPVYHGNPADLNYNSRTFGRWDNPSFMLMSGTFQVGVLAHHSSTNAELLGGAFDDVSFVQVRCDGNSTWTTISGPSANANAGGTVDWNFTVNDATWADGLHKCDAIITPTTGPDAIMNGPPINPYGQNADEYQSVTAAMIDSGTRGVAGQVLTIPASAVFLNSRSASNTGVLGVGWSVSAYKVAPGTFIDGDHTHGNTDCGGGAGSCTGTGGAGTYHVTVSQAMYGAVGTGSISGTTATITVLTSGAFNIGGLYGSGVTAGTSILDGGPGGNTGAYPLDTSQTVASTTLYATAPATFGNERSFYFLTNHNGTLPRAKVFICQGTCNGVTGNDANAGTSASPVATVSRAYKIALDADPTTFFKGKFGLTACVMSSGSNFNYQGGTWFGAPATYLGYVDFAAANDSLCGLGTDPGGEVMTNDVNTRGVLPDPGHAAWHDLTFNGLLDNAATHDSVYFAAFNVTHTKGAYGTGGIFAGGAWMCLESKAFFGVNGCAGADFIRNSTIKYTMTDPLHDVHGAEGNTIDGGGGDPGMWLAGTYSTATPLVLTGITLPADVTAAGNTLTSLLVGDGDAHGHGPIPANNFGTGACMTLSGSNWSGNVVSATSSSITFQNDGQIDSGQCTNGATVYPYAGNGDHPDQIQLSKLSYAFFDVFVQNNSFNATYQSAGQAPFIEGELLDGLIFSGNTYTKNITGDNSKADAVNGGNNNVTYANNQWAGSTFFNHNNYVGSNAETFFKDKCLSGGTLLPPVTAGTNQQAVSATTNACY